MEHVSSAVDLPLSDLRRKLRPYAESRTGAALWQIFNSLIPFVLLWAAMATLAPSFPWLLVPLALLGGLILTRIFVLQHDCGHHTLFPTKRLNNIFGNLLSVVTLTPLYNWRREHNLHHAHLGNLDKVEHGDFWLMTVTEYKAASRVTRLKYRIYRSPLLLFVMGPLFYLVVRRRFPVNLPKHLRKERLNVGLTNLGLLCVYGPLAYFLGWKVFLSIFLPIVAIGASICVFGFYIQHTFEEGYWARSEGWDYHTAALTGSSYYDLPRWMIWFTADISVHHIHHLDSSIPNYNLRRCLRDIPELRPRKSLTFTQSLKCVVHKLWDEERNRFVGYHA
jgi:acyl-lipid omega-6 desaturase (Delta-12 desaturase)